MWRNRRFQFSKCSKIDALKIFKFFWHVYAHRAFFPSRSIRIRLNSPIPLRKVALSLYQCKKFYLNPTKDSYSQKSDQAFENTSEFQAAEIDSESVSSNVEIEGRIWPREETDQHRKFQETAVIQPLRVRRQLHSLRSLILSFIFHVADLKYDSIRTRADYWTDVQLVLSSLLIIVCTCTLCGDHKSFSIVEMIVTIK